MEIQDDTEALRKLFAELEPESALALVANPKAALKAMNVPVSAESRVDITMKNRADRVTSSNLTGIGGAAAPHHRHRHPLPQLRRRHHHRHPLSGITAPRRPAVAAAARGCGVR